LVLGGVVFGEGVVAAGGSDGITGNGTGAGVTGATQEAVIMKTATAQNAITQKPRLPETPDLFNPMPMILA
jgi:hypothetical protein